MIGFKKTPVKLVIGIFIISVLVIVLLYIDSTHDKPKPTEDTITMDLSISPPEFKNKLIHEVKKGESLSIIFEEKKVPLNTAYKIFDFDKDNVLSSIKPGDVMEFNYIGEKLEGIEIIKDETNSILIDISESVSIESIKKKVSNSSLMYKIHNVVADTIGEKFEQIFDVYYDYNFSLNSIRYFNASIVPKINQIVPNEISNVKYDCHLGNIEFIEKNDKKSKLLKALF